MAKESAGLLLYRLNKELEVLLAHPGGPFFRSKDNGHWTIPKGEGEAGESKEETALREAREELGVPLSGTLQSLGEIRQRGGKKVSAFAMEVPEGFTVPEQPQGMTFELEWPPRSGRAASFPEIDRAVFFPLGEALKKIKAEQTPFLTRLLDLLDGPGNAGRSQIVS